MGWLSQQYQNIKKKFQDWEQPVAQTVSSGLGSMYNSAKNSLNSVDNYVAPKIQSFNDNVVQPTENFVQQAPQKITDYFNNDQTTGGFAKNSALGFPKAFSTYTNDILDNKRNILPYANTEKDTNLAQTAGKKLYNFGAGIFNNVAQEGIIKPVSDLATGITDVAMNQPINRDTFKSGAFRTGADLAGGGKNLQNTLSDIGQTAMPILNAWGGGKAENAVEKGFANLGVKQLAKKSATTGAGIGSLFGLAQGVQDNKDKSLGADLGNTALSGLGGAATGAALGYATPYAGAEVKNIIGDVKKYIDPKTIVDKASRYEPTVEGIFAPGGFQQVKLRENAFNPQSATFKLMDKVGGTPAGMSIKDVSGVNPYEAKINADLGNPKDIIAQKNAKAKAIVGNQIANQKSENGFVAPQDIPFKGNVPFNEEFGRNVKPVSQIISEKDKQMADALGLSENKIPNANSDLPQYNSFQQRAYDKKNARVGALRDLMNVPRTLRAGGYLKKEAEIMGPQEAGIKVGLLKLGYPKQVIERMDLNAVQDLIDGNVQYNTLPTHVLDKYIVGKGDITPEVVTVNDQEKAMLKNAATEAKFKNSEVYSNIQAKKMVLNNQLKDFNDPAENRLAMELLQHPENSQEILARSKDPNAIIGAVRDYKNYTDYVYNLRHGVGAKPIPYSQNYFHTQWDLKNPADAQRYEQLLKIRPKNYQGGYTQPTVFKDLNEGEAAKFKPLFKTLAESATHLNEQNLRGLPNNALVQSLIKNGAGKHISDVDFYGAVKPNIPGMEGTFLSKPLHNELRNLESSVLNKTPVVKQYDILNKNLKDTILSLLNFHMLNITKKVAGKELFSKNPLMAVGEPIKGIHAYLSPDYFAKNLQRSVSDGTADWMAKSGMNTFSYPEMTGNFVSKGKYNPINIIHGATFDRAIPQYSMDLARAAMNKGIDPASVEGRNLGKQINALLGSINWKTHDGNILNNPEIQSIMNKVFLAPSFNIGKMQNWKAALMKGGTEGNFARGAILGDLIVTGLLAEGGHRLTTGQFNKPQDILQNDVLSPTIPLPYKSPTGRQLTADLPGTDISDAAKIFQDPLHSLQSRTSPAISLGTKIFTGKDYYGNSLTPVESKNPLWDTTRNALLSELPGGVYQGVQEARGKQNLATTLLNIGGLRVKTDPNDPTMKYFNELDNAKASLTNPNDQSAWDQLHPVNKNTNGDYIIQPSVWDSAEKATTYLSHPNVLDADTKMNQALMQQGQKIDPFFSLAPEQQQVALTYATLPPQDPQKTNIENNASWMADYQSKRSDFFASLPPSNPDKPKQDIQYPQPTPQVESLQNQYYQMNDPAERARFLKSNPDLVSQFAAAEQYSRNIRAAKNLPQYDAYPESSPEVKNIMDEYNQLPKGTGARSAWINSNPDAYNKMITYYTQSSLFNLEKSAGQAAFQNEGFDKKGLKAISSLGTYDIGTDANGNKILSPGAGNGGSSFGFGSGTKAKYASLIDNNPLDMLKIIMSHPVKYRIRKGGNITPIHPVQFAKVHRKAGQLIHLNKLA